jgi:YVTN family beta-propeller protein
VAPSSEYRFRILGEVEALAGERALDLGGRKPTALLALLLLNAGNVVSTDRLVDELWGDEPPRTARKSLQVHVSRLRRELGEEMLETRPHGYALRVERGQVDLHRFEDLLERGRAALAAGEERHAATLLREALVVWRGEPLAGLEEPFARAASARLEDLRLAAVEARIEADLALGRHASLVGELDALVAEHPFREGMRRQQMLALYRSGRQADALASYRAARRTFSDELGVEPGPELRALEAAVLAHDPALAAPPRMAAGRRPKRAAVLATSAVVLVGLAAAGVLVARSSSDEDPPPPRGGPVPVANSVVRIDPRTNRVAQVVRVGRDPEDVAIGAGAVWVVNFRDRTVSRVDASGDVQTIGGVPRADHLAVEGDNVWVSSFDRSSVSRIDSRTGEVAASLGVPTKHAEGLAVGGGYLWIANPSDVRAKGLETVSRVDLSSGRVVSRIAVGKTPIFLAFGYGSVWVANYDSDTVSVVRPGSRAADTIDVGDGPLGIATGFGAVWVVCYWDRQLIRIDPRTREVVARIPIDVGPLDVGAGAGAVWVTNRESGTVLRIDPRTNKVVKTIRLPEALTPRTVAARDGQVWFSVRFCPTGPCI